VHPKQLAVILERLAELIENKMAVSKALRQVGDEIVAFDKYCHDTRKTPSIITKDNLKNCKI